MRRDQQRRDDNFLKCLGQAIRAQRLAQVLSQEELGVKCRLHRTYITDIENGLRNVSVLTLKRVAEALGVTLSLLFSEAERLLKEGSEHYK